VPKTKPDSMKIAPKPGKMGRMDDHTTNKRVGYEYNEQTKSSNSDNDEPFDKETGSLQLFALNATRKQAKVMTAPTPERSF
jgi:hypothetical protein